MPLNLPDPKLYRSDIDVLRAFAVVTVVLYHISVHLLPGGFVGVDVFFVISGYLITGQLEQRLENESFTFLDFYTRRFRRLYPALCLVLGVTAVLGAILLVPDAQNQLGRELRAVATISVNYYFLGHENDYFGMAADHQPLLHMWSLSVEEQFYLLWPLLLWGMQRLLDGRNERLRLASDVLLWLIFSASLAWCEYSSAHDSPQAFYGMPSRAWEFAGGGILALTQGSRCKRQLLGHLLRWAGLGVLLASVALIDGSDLFPGYVVLAPVLGALLFLAGGRWDPLAASPTGLLGRVVQHTGRISYSFYLWHWVLLAFARSWYLERSLPRDALVGGVLSYLLAHLTYVYVEQPLRQGTTPWSGLNHLQFRHGFYAILLLYILGNAEIFEPLVLTSTQQEVALWAHDPFGPPLARCQRVPLAPAAACSLGQPRDPIRIMVWGDSHAGHLRPILDVYSQNHPLRILTRIKYGCLPLDGVIPAGDHSLQTHCLGFAHAVDTELGALHRSGVRGVLLDARWSWYLADGPSSLGLLRSGESVRVLKTGQGLLNHQHSWAIFVDRMRQQLADIRHQGMRVVVVLPEPVLPYPAPDCLARLPTARCNQSRYQFEQQRRDVKNLFQSLAAGDPEIRLLDTSPEFCDVRWCYAYRDGIINFSDDNHISAARALASQPLYNTALDWLARGQ